MSPSKRKRTRQERIRLGVLALGVGLFFAVIVGRLVHLQVFEHERYHDIVMNQSSGTVGIPAPRGVIYDRRGQTVAKNVIGRSLYAYPQNRAQLKRVAAYVDRLLGLPSGSARRTYSLQVGRFSWVKRMMDDELALHVRKSAPKGLYLREESCRSYPYGSTGRQILGFTDIDNIGRSGLELSYDTVLAGDSGVADIYRDGLRNTYRVDESALIQPEAGRSLVLTVDWRLQDIVEDELHTAVKEYNASSAMAAFLNCHTGEILALAHYDPTEGDSRRPIKLRAVTDWYEPGSAFKTFVAAGLLDAGLVDFAETTFCEEGAWKIGRRTLHDDKELGWLTFREIIELSSNIGIGKHAIQLGGDELIAACRRFGFGQKLRCGLPGESAGRLAAPNRWSDYTISALAMGHSVAVTALQMATAFGAVANGGELLRPCLILGYVDENGQLVRRSGADVIGRAALSESSDSLRAFLRGVVEHGTATLVNSPIVPIAGKTGTGEIPDLKTGRMFKNRFVASFGGFFPADQPLIAGIVVVVDPRPITYGGHTAGPAFRKVAERYAMLNPDMFDLAERTLARESGSSAEEVEAPDLVGRDVSLAMELAERVGVRLRATGERGRVLWQFPPPDRLLFQGDDILVWVSEEESAPDTMPDFRGLSLRAVAAFLHRAGIAFRIEGNGQVVRQEPGPGKTMTDGIPCRLVCRPG